MAVLKFQMCGTSVLLEKHRPASLFSFQLRFGFAVGEGGCCSSGRSHNARRIGIFESTSRHITHQPETLPLEGELVCSAGFIGLLIPIVLINSACSIWHALTQGQRANH